MLHKSEATTNPNGAGRNGDHHFDDMSIDLDPLCNCCCGTACSGNCGCHGCVAQVNHAQAQGRQPTQPQGRFCAVPAEPRNIINALAVHTLSESIDCLSISLGDNSIEATRSPLTYANLAQHTSYSLAEDNRLDHLHRCVESEDDPNPGQLFLTEDEGFLEVGDMDDQPLEESLVVERELASDHKSRLSDWDRSFSRSSPSASIYLREIGMKHYFIRNPLPLLEEHRHHNVQAPGCRCDCDG